MANNRIPALIDRQPGGCSTAPGPGARHPHPPHPALGCTPAALGAEITDEQTRRFQLATWLLERHNRLGAQRAHSALMLVLGNVVLVVLAFLLFFLVAAINPDWWLVLIGTGLAFFWGLVSTAFALLAGATLQPGGGSPAAEAGLFFQSGQPLLISEAQFRERFQRVARQQMLEGVLGEIYAQHRGRARQEHWMRWAMLAFGLALLLFALAVLVMLLAVSV